METAIIAAIIASITTLVGVYIGHWLAVSRRTERYADFLYQERFKAYMEYSIILEKMKQAYYETKWDEEGIKRLSRLWIRTYDFIGARLLVYSQSVLMEVMDVMDRLDPIQIVKTKNTDFSTPFMEIREIFLYDLEIPHFDKEIKTVLDRFTRRNRPENITAAM